MALHLRVLPVVLIAALSGCAAHSAPPAPAVTVEPPQPLPATQHIFLDPVTGEPRTPTPEERQQMRVQAQTTAKQAKSVEPPRVVEYPDGTVGVFTKRTRNQIRVEQAPDGSLHSYCKDGADGKEQP